MAYAERAFHDRWVAPWVRHQTLGRYQWASKMVKGRKVIEVACGTGEGTALLKNAGAAAVDGWDSSPEAIAEARQRHLLPDVRFELGEAEKLPVEDAAYDVYVSFETIEHLKDERPYLSEVRRVLKPSGLFLCSTPNRAVTNPGKTLRDKPYNPHHLREYAIQELAALLAPYFPHIEFFGQSAYSKPYVHALGSLARLSPGLSVKAHQFRKLAWSPFDSARRHLPTEWKQGEEREILIALCRPKKRGS